MMNCRYFSKTTYRWFGIVLPILFIFAAPDPTAACISSQPPQPFCGKTLVLSQAVPGVVLLPGGGTFDVTTLVNFNLFDFPPGSGLCPGGPYTVTVELTATCTPGADGSGMTTTGIGLGFSEVIVPVTVGAGPPRLCEITGTATMTLADGMVLTTESDAVACLAEPAPGNPDLPRLDLQLLTPEVVPIHPGDQAGYVYRITNNDPTESFDGELTVETVNTSRLPGASGPMPPGTGVFSVSDPVEGDNFPVAFVEDLVEGCVLLPPDPPNPTIPLIAQPVSLGPGEFVDIEVFARAWGMCGSGSCSRAKVVLDGDFADLTPGLACAGFITAVDSQIPPSYLWPDGGQAAQVLPGGPPNQVTLFGQPFPGRDASIDLATVQAQLIVNEIPFQLPPNFFSELVEPERARTQMQFADPKGFQVDSFFDIQIEIDFAPSPGESFQTELRQMELIGGAPTGFENVAPAGQGLAEIREPGFPVDSFFDITYQIDAVGIDETLDRRQITFSGVGMERRPDGSGFRVMLQGGQVAPGDGNQLLAIEFNQDFRGFFSELPTGQPALIFTDGFESGNVSAWSTSVP